MCRRQATKWKIYPASLCEWTLSAEQQQFAEASFVFFRNVGGEFVHELFTTFLLAELLLQRIENWSIRGDAVIHYFVLMQCQTLFTQMAAWCVAWMTHSQLNELIRATTTQAALFQSRHTKAEILNILFVSSVTLWKCYISFLKEEVGTMKSLPVYEFIVIFIEYM